MLRALAPLVLIGAIPFAALARAACRRTPRCARAAMASALPAVLFATFVLCPVVSKGIFASWDCVSFELEAGNGTEAEPGTERSFLAEDLRVVCTDAGERGVYHQTQIAALAYVFVLIWPVGMPLLYLAVLIPNREALRQRRKTQMVRATEFLHKEYAAPYFWWEVLPLLQRLVLTGAVLLVPVEHDNWRIFLGLLVVVGYLTLLQFVQPYSRREMNTLATAAQFSLVCVFLGGAFIKLFSSQSSSGGSILGCRGGDAASGDEAEDVLVAVFVMVGFNFSVLTLYVCLAGYQFSTAYVLPSIRLSVNGQTPDLKMHKEQKFHLFLSHIWSSGQDQVATVKRELQLLLTDVKVFLDVDDLEEIDKLPMYVRQTHTMLFFLSKGYFFSRNCRKEIEATLAHRSPIILLHEADINRGGLPLAQCQADCPDAWLTSIFAPRRPVIPWMRIKEFKLVSLKMIVSSMLHHQSHSLKPRPVQVESPSRSSKVGEKVGEKVDEKVGILRRLSRRAPPDPAAATQLAWLAEQEEAPPVRYIDGVRVLDDIDADVERGGGGGAGADAAGGSKSAERKYVSSEPPEAALGGDLYVPGEVTRQSLGFLTKTTLLVSAANPGCDRLAQELVDRHPELRSEALHDPSAAADGGSTSVLGRAFSFARSFDTPSFGTATPGALRRAQRRRDRRRRVFLLYLNEETWQGEQGSLLAVQVHAAREAGLKIVLAHENDPQLGGCDFDNFFRSTPQDLINGGLYGRIAVACYAGLHRLVSCCLLAKELGATRSRCREGIAQRFMDHSTAAADRVTAVRGTLVPRGPKGGGGAGGGGSRGSKGSGEEDVRASEGEVQPTAEVGGGAIRKTTSQIMAELKRSSAKFDSPRGSSKGPSEASEASVAAAPAALAVEPLSSRRRSKQPYKQPSASVSEGSSSSSAPPPAAASEPAAPGPAPLLRKQTADRLFEVLQSGDFPDEPETSDEDEAGEGSGRLSRRSSISQLVASGEELSGCSSSFHAGADFHAPEFGSFGSPARGSEGGESDAYETDVPRSAKVV